MCPSPSHSSISESKNTKNGPKRLDLVGARRKSLPDATVILVTPRFSNEKKLIIIRIIIPNSTTFYRKGLIEAKESGS